MKENTNIDELLNSFIDDQLTPRQKTEVKRLINNDSRIAERLAELRKCKMLLASLPTAKAPPELLHDIKASLERRALAQQPTSAFDRQAGARHLMFRKLLSAAAMIALTTTLAVVIYSIVGPETVIKKPLVSENWNRPATKPESPEPATTVAATTEESVAKAQLAKAGFNGRLELKTPDVAVLGKLINNTVENNPLLSYITPASADAKANTYTISCTNSGLDQLLIDLASIWEKLDSATLFVQANQAGAEIAVIRVSPEQIAKIADQAILERQIELAGTFAALNDTTTTLPAENLSVASDNKTNLAAVPKPIPKPLLTSAEERVKKPGDKTKVNNRITLTIVITETK